MSIQCHFPNMSFYNIFHFLYQLISAIFFKSSHNLGEEKKKDPNFLFWNWNLIRNWNVLRKLSRRFVGLLSFCRMWPQQNFGFFIRRGHIAIKVHYFVIDSFGLFFGIIFLFCFVQFFFKFIFFRLLMIFPDIPCRTFLPVMVLFLVGFWNLTAIYSPERCVP